MGISKCQASLWLSDHSRVSVSMNENDKSKLLNLNFHIVRFFQVDQIPILSKHFHGTFRYSKLLCLIRSTDRADRTLDWRPKNLRFMTKVCTALVYVSSTSHLTCHVTVSMNLTQNSSTIYFVMICGG